MVAILQIYCIILLNNNPNSSTFTQKNLVYMTNKNKFNTSNQDTIIETKTCPQCNCTFTITQSDRDFYDKISPTFGDYVATIPNPTLFPECRQRRRMAFRNERKLYRRICDATQQPIISIYSPDKQYTVYDQSIWRGDSWDPLDY